MRGWEHHDDDARCDCRPADAELIKCSHKRLRVLFSKLSLFCDCTQENMKYKDCSYCLVERLRLWHNFGIVITIFPLQGRATSSSGRGCCCCCLGTLLGNALSPPTAKLGKIMNLCSSGATASTTSLSSTGQAERSGGVPGGGAEGGGGSGNSGGGGKTSNGSAEGPTLCFAGGSGTAGAIAGTEELSNANSPANGAGGATGSTGSGQQPTGSNGHSHLHNENNANMPPETRPKMVTVKHPESNKPKPTTKKSKPIQADQDVIKALQRCRDEGKYNLIFFLMK